MAESWIQELDLLHGWFWSGFLQGQEEQRQSLDWQKNRVLKVLDKCWFWLGYKSWSLVWSLAKARQIGVESQISWVYIESSSGRGYIGAVRISPDWSVNSLTLISLVAGKDQQPSLISFQRFYWLWELTEHCSTLVTN